MIRQMTMEDISQVTAIEKEIFSDAWSYEMFEDCLKYSYYWCLVCEGEGQIKGYLITQILAGEGEIHKIGVIPSFRRKKVEDTLMKKLEEEGKRRQLSKWFLEVRESNKKAIALYLKWQFTQIDSRKNYYHNPLEDALIFQKEQLV